MEIIFVRHGHPNYELDCLTDLGHLQAQAAAQRLKDEKIDDFYSSSCGRAYETGCHIAKLHGKDVIKIDFMREISWKSHPWFLARDWVKENKNIMNENWQTHEDYKNDVVVSKYNFVSEKFDEWLSGLGLEREGVYYRVTKESDKTILLASHAGSSSVVLSHILNMPFSFMCGAFEIDFTSVTKVSFEGKEGELTSPKVTLFNDAKHIEKLSVENIIEM